MTRRHLVSLGAALAVVVLCLFYIETTVLQTAPGSQHITVSLPAAGGLYAGSNVSYRGLVVGKVTSIALTRDGVAAKVRLSPHADIPRSASARVRSLSPIGEQFLDFQPTRATGPFLSSGDTVRAQASDIPTTVADVAESLDTLMREVDPGKVSTVLSELNAGLDGAEGDLQQLAANSKTLVTAVNDNLTPIEQLLTSGSTVLKIGADSRADILRLTKSYATFVEWLKGYQPQLYATLIRAPGQIEQMRQLIKALGADLPSFLTAQGDVADILSTRSAALRAFLQYFPQGLEAFASTISNGRVQLDIVARKGPQCVYSTSERDAHDTAPRPLQDGGYCSSSLTTYSQRGAQFAPQP